MASIGPVATIIGTLLALNVIKPFGQDALAAAVDRTAGASTAAITVHFASTGRGAAPVVFDASGDYDLVDGRARLRYDVAAAPGGRPLTDVEVRLRGNDAYLRLPGARAGARPWVHADLAAAPQQIADYAAAAGLKRTPPEFASLSELQVADPSQVLAELHRAGHVTELGPSTVLGVPTRDYRAVIAPHARRGPLTVVASIDHQQLVRRLALATSDGPAPFRMTMDFVRFGTRLDVRNPPAAKVSELSDVLDRSLR